MPAQIAGFEYDIFVSYRHNDNKVVPGVNADKGWVFEFVANLTQELEATLKGKVIIYFDVNPHDGLLETNNVDASLSAKLKTLFFIPILSQTYCDPESFAWRKEFQAFNRLAAADRFGQTVKLLNGNVSIHELDPEDIQAVETELGARLRPVDFIFKSKEVNRPLRAQEEDPLKNVNRPLYFFHRLVQVAAFLVGLVCIPVGASGQLDSVAVVREIARFQNDLNAEYKNPEESPLSVDEIKTFSGHDFFPIDLSYRVEAELTRIQNAPVFKMKTSSAKLRDYRKYGVLHFMLRNHTYTLTVYQSMDLLKTEKYKDYLFLPFTDRTNDSLSYAAGRYIELHIPEHHGPMIVDFNQAYNPYCAYSHKYSCPVVPAENNLDTEILAGVRFRKEQKKE